MQNLSKIGQEIKKLQKMGNDFISKNSSAIFCVLVVFTYTYCCTKFQVDFD